MEGMEKRQIPGVWWWWEWGSITVPCEGNPGQQKMKGWQVDNRMFFCSSFPSASMMRDGCAELGKESAAARGSDYSPRLDRDSKGTCYWSGKQCVLFVMGCDGNAGAPGAGIPWKLQSQLCSAPPPLAPGVSSSELDNENLWSPSQFIFSFHSCWEGSA